MDDRLPVYILTTESRNSGIQNVSRLFSHPMFDVIVPNQRTSLRTEFLAKLSQAAAEEATKIISILALSADSAPDKSIIIVKDNSISHLNPEHMAARIKSILATKDSFDIFYLCKWNDRCQLFTNKQSLPDTATFITQTQSPHGFQAVIVTPQGRDIILGRTTMANDLKFKIDRPIHEQLTTEISNGNIIAYCSTPNLIDFDIRHAMSNSDFAKLNECQAVGQPNQNVGSSTAAYIWFFIVILAIFLLAWALIRIGPGTRN